MFVQLTKDHLGQKTGYRFDTDEKVAKSLVELGVAELCKDDPLAPIIAKSVEAMLSGLTKSVNDTLDAAVKQFGNELAKSRKNAIPALFGPGGNGDPKKTFGNFLISIRAKDYKALEEMGSAWVDWDNKGDDIGKKAPMSTQGGSGGGFVVPTELHERIMQLAIEDAIVRPRATRVPMKARMVQVPALDVATAPTAGQTAFLGGVIANWTEEATQPAESEPNLKQVELTNYELSGFSIISNTLLADSAVSLENFVMKLFAKAVGWYEDYAFLRGDGAYKPLGIREWTGLIQATRSAGGAFALQDAATMYGRLLPGWNTRQTCWVVHPTVMAKLIQMTASGTGSDTVWIDNAREKPRMVLLGIPVEVSEKLTAIGTLGDVYLANFGHYLLGDREQIEIAYSEHVKFLTNQSVWRFVARVGGLPWLRDKITLSDAASTLSPFVGLAP